MIHLDVARDLTDIKDILSHMGRKWECPIKKRYAILDQTEIFVSSTLYNYSYLTKCFYSFSTYLPVAAIIRNFFQLYNSNEFCFFLILFCCGNSKEYRCKKSIETGEEEQNKKGIWTPRKTGREKRAPMTALAERSPDFTAWETQTQHD